MRSKLWLFLLFAALLWICDQSASTTFADVRDTTGTFSREAIEQANKVIGEIKQRYNKDVIVEVFPEIPQSLRARYDPSRRDEFYEQWQQSRARELNLDGIHILITRNPGRVEVGAGGETSKRGFTPQDRDQLTQRIAMQFRNQQFDQGLLDGVNYIRQSFLANLGPRSGQPNYNVQTPAAGRGGETQQRGSGLSWFWWLLIIGVGLFVLMRFLRRRRQTYSPGYGAVGGQPANYGGREPYHGQQYPGGTTGAGGWGRGMLGGLLGGMAGGWLYDRMRGGGGDQGGGGGGTAYGGEAGPSPMQSDQGEGFRSSGADFGGGDFGGGGGGGGGGGDFGGGDAGGSSGADF